jgi:hypothetical protein
VDDDVGDDVSETCVDLARVVTADVAVGVAMEDDGGMQRFRGVGTRRRRADADADADVDDEKRTRYDRLRSRIRRRTSDDG